MMRLIVVAGSTVDVNRSCFPDGSTTLHCARSSGSLDAVEAVRMLLAAGANITIIDCCGHRPLDVVVSPPKVGVAAGGGGGGVYPAVPASVAAVERGLQEAAEAHIVEEARALLRWR